MTVKRAQGFTLLELIVVISIIAILAGILLDRVWFYQEQAEKAAMEQTVGALQSALVMQYGNLLAQGREREASMLETENPLRWLMKRPPNYVGEFYAPTPGAVAPGNWAFDLKSRELVYVPSRNEYFIPGADGYKWVRYHVRLEYENTEIRPGRTPRLSVTGVVFKPATPYQWMGMQ